MKKLMVILLAAVLAVTPAFAGEAEYVSFRGRKFPADAEYIDLGTIPVKTADMNEYIAFLKKMPNLKKVDMFQQPIGRTRRETLQETFPEIEFGMTMIIGGEHYLRTDATAFSTLHGLPGQIWHTSDDFSALKYCRNLYALDLGHNYIDDLSFLYDLPKLRVLILAKNLLTDITPIGSLKDLEYLEIFGNDVSDISILATLPHLADLNITGNRVADLNPLREIRSLQRAWVCRSDKYYLHVNEDAEAVSLLRQTFPEAEIDDFSEGTDGTWRKHPHYFTIQRVFETGVYEPFDDLSFDEYAYPFPPGEE